MMFLLVMYIKMIYKISRFYDYKKNLRNERQ